MGYLLLSHSCKRTVVVLFNSYRGDKVVHIFRKGINTRVNVIARLEFELTISLSNA